MSDAPTPHVAWDDLPWEKVTDTISRRLVTSDRMMIAQIFLKKGAVVPRHQHENEQITYVVEGSLRFHVGDPPGREVVVSTGEVLVLPSNVPHTAEALEDTLDVDVFCPPRQDWLDGTDSYFHDEPASGGDGE